MLADAYNTWLLLYRSHVHEYNAIDFHKHMLGRTTLCCCFVGMGIWKHVQGILKRVMYVARKVSVVCRLLAASKFQWNSQEMRRDSGSLWITAMQAYLVSHYGRFMHKGSKNSDVPLAPRWSSLVIHWQIFPRNTSRWTRAKYTMRVDKTKVEQSFWVPREVDVG